MIRTWPLLFFIVLAGCYSDQEQHLDVCQREADGKIYSTHPDIQEKEKADSIEVCMRAGGYELIEDSCPTSIRTSLIVPRSSVSWGALRRRVFIRCVHHDPVHRRRDPLQ